MPRFLLLLHRPSSTVSGDSPEELRERIGRYRAWREEMTRAGKILAGEKLAAGGFRLRRDGAEALVADADGDRDVISGYFLLQADNEREAREIAGRCPHLESGGTIELRQIEPT